MKETNTWPDWEYVRQIGSGSFGKVYEIQKIENGKTYRAALKIITIPQHEAEIENAYSDGMTVEEVTEYFKSIVTDFTNEIAVMSELKGYTNIVSYDDHMVIEHDDQMGWDILIKMELLTPLLEWVREHPLTEEDVIRLGCDMCSALEICHKNHIIHRDIKPQNIFVNRHGDFKLGDFGVARVVEKTNTVLSSKGTDTYMAPEVVRGDAYSYTADIYSLGIVLYRFLNRNRTPFLPLEGGLRHEDRKIAQEKRIAGEAITTPLLGSDELKNVILKTLQYKPERRFQSAFELRSELEKCYHVKNGEIPTVDSEPPKKRNFGIFFVIFLVIAVVAASLMLIKKSQSTPSSTPADDNSQMYDETKEELDKELETMGTKDSAVHNNCMDIAKYPWGTPLETIRSDYVTAGMINGVDYAEIDNGLMFSAELLGYPMYVYYWFNENSGLYSVVYEMKENLADETYATALFDLVEAYEEKIGMAEFSDVEFFEKFRNYPILYMAQATDSGLYAHWGDEVAKEYGVPQAISGGELYLVLQNENGEAFLVMEYRKSEEVPKNIVHRYEIIAEDLSWQEAKRACEQKGGYLATITSEEEYQEVCSLAEEAGITYLWLGANLYADTDEWQTTGWITGEPWSFEKWYPGEPSKEDMDGTKEYYLCLWKAKHEGNDLGWTFNDQRNDIVEAVPSISGNIGYICEFETEVAE